MMLTYTLGFLLLSQTAHADISPDCIDPITQQSQPILQMVLAGATESEKGAELRLQLELQLLVEQACLQTTSIGESNFLQMTIAQQQSLLVEAFPETVMMLWLDTTETERWRAMLLTGAPPRTVLRVVESAPSQEALPALAIAITQTLQRLQVEIQSDDHSTPSPEKTLPIEEGPTVPNIDESQPASSRSSKNEFGGGPLMSLTFPQGTGPQWTAGVGLFWTRLIRPETSLSIRSTIQHNFHTDTRVIGYSIGPRLGRDLSNGPFRPSVGLEVQWFQLQAAVSDETYGLHFANLNGQVGAEFRPRNWNTVLGLYAGLPLRDIDVKRASDNTAVWAPGPLLIRFEISLETN